VTIVAMSMLRMPKSSRNSSTEGSHHNVGNPWHTLLITR
jgi:hypothetical protein